MTDPTVRDLEPQSALDHNQLALSDGVLATPGSTDCRISVDSGALGANDTLVADPGQIRLGGNVVDIPTQPVSVPAADPDKPRKDLVVAKGNGDVTVVKGTPEVPQYSRLLDPADRTLSNAYRPTPTDATALDGVPFAVILVFPGAQVVSGGPDGDILDRRSFVVQERLDAAESHLGTFVGGKGEVSGPVTHKQPNESIHGERSVNEVERWIGDEADLVRLSQQNGANFAAEIWNAYYDGSDFRYQVSGETAWRLSTAGRGITISTAPEGLSGEVINWQTTTIQGGSIDEADHAARADSAAQADNSGALGGRAPDGYATEIPRDEIVYKNPNGNGTNHLIRLNNADQYIIGGGQADRGQATFEIMAFHIRNYSGGAGEMSAIRADMMIQAADGDWHDLPGIHYTKACEFNYSNFNAGDIRFGYNTPTYRTEPQITIRKVGKF